jgi:hypothetical protein
MGNGPGSQLSPILRIDYRDRYSLPATRARGWIALNFAKHNQGVDVRTILNRLALGRRRLCLSLKPFDRQ